MVSSIRSIVFVAVACLSVSSAAGQGYGEHPSHPELSDQANAHLHMLNELGSRRRSNALFRNEQQPTAGVQISYVNVGRGNLTFARRDLVAVGRVPLVFARVYDSSAPGATDFGPGWSLAAAESISVRGEEMFLRDETGSLVVLRSKGRAGRFMPVSPHSNVLYVVADGSGRLTASLQDGWHRMYAWDAGAYRLVSVVDAFGNAVRLEYSGGLLTMMRSANGRFIRVHRRDGRVVSIEDDSGRGVRYEYDRSSRLEKVFDLGGNEWSYQYDADDRLTSIRNPESFQELAAQYDATGKVRRMLANGFDRSFRYRGRSTTVRDASLGTAEFVQDNGGMTIELRSFAGVATGLTLDDAARVLKLRRDGQVEARFQYAGAHLKTALLGSRPAARRLEYLRGTDGQLESISGALSENAQPDQIVIDYDAARRMTGWRREGYSRSYELSERGDLRRLLINSNVYSFEMNTDGQIVSSAAASGDLRFAYASNGKLARTTYWNGAIVSYEHDALGTRSFGDWSELGRVSYTYDRAGNAREILTVDGKGREGGHRIALSPQQRVEAVSYVNGGSFVVDYDTLGNPARIQSSSGDDARYSFDAQNRLERIETAVSVVLDHHYSPGEPDLRTQTDHKTMRTLLASRRAPVAFGNAAEIIRTRVQGSPFESIVFDEEMVEFRLVSPLAVVLPDAAIYDGLVRTRLLRSARGTPLDQERFEQPSNILFLPPEYVSMNCCIPCDPASMPDLCGTCEWLPGADAPQCYCAPPPPPPPTPPSCEAVHVDNAARLQAFSGMWPIREPYERGVTMICIGTNNIDYVYYATSWTTTNDPCAVGLTLPGNDWVGVVHTHPYFSASSEYRAGVGCHGDKSFLTMAQLQAYNTANANFSDGDRSSFRGRDKPLYMRVPNGDRVKKLLNTTVTTLP